MKPNFSQLLFASRYMLPLWVLGGLWLWFSGQAEFIWRGFDDTDRMLLVLVLCAVVVGLRKALPKVWAYEKTQREFATSGRDPEQVRRQRVGMLRLLGVAGWGLSLWWLSEHSYTVNPNLYLTALGIAAGGSLWAVVAIYSRLPVSLKTRLRRSLGREQNAFIVRWALPVPKRAPNGKDISAGLPDYCKLLMTSSPKQPQPGMLSKVLELVGA